MLDNNLLKNLFLLVLIFLLNGCISGIVDTIIIDERAFIKQTDFNHDLAKQDIKIDRATKKANNLLLDYQNDSI